MSVDEAFGELPDSWRPALGDEWQAPYFRQLADYVAQERREHQVFPPPDEVFAALEHTPLAEVRVLLLGQDPYHDDGQAHGLCFSVRRGVKLPPSLRNVYRELHDDLGVATPDHGNLEAWAERGVLLLNTVLTVHAHQANSHRKRGWERFTDAVIRAVAQREEPAVFVLWGKPAQKKRTLIDRASASRGGEPHEVLTAAHPSPLSARNGFFGSRPFSRINAALERWGRPPIDWSLPDSTC